MNNSTQDTVFSKLVSAIVLLGMALSGLGSGTILTHAQQITTSTRANDSGITVDFRSYVQDVDLRQAVFEAIRAKPEDLLVGTQFAITSQRIEDNWTFISVASLDGPDSSLEHVGSGDSAGLFLATKDAELGWRAALAGTPLFSHFLANVPESLVSSNAKLYLDPLKKPRSTAVNVEYKFPWPASEWEYRQGWHSNAVDIGTRGTNADKRVLASATGTVIRICRGTLSANVHIQDASGVILKYFHIDISQLDPEIEEMKPVQVGQVLGVLKSGAWLYKDDGCGEAPDQKIDSAHIHWELPTDRAFTADGWTIQRCCADSTWRRGSETRIPNASPYQKLPSTNKPPAVILYELPNYQGHSLILTDSDLDLCDNIISGQTTNPNPCFDPKVQTWNDIASSIKVSPGYTAILLLHSKDWDIDQYGQKQSRYSCNQEVADFSLKLFWALPDLM